MNSLVVHCLVNYDSFAKISLKDEVSFHSTLYFIVKEWHAHIFKIYENGNFKGSISNLWMLWIRVKVPDGCTHTKFSLKSLKAAMYNKRKLESGTIAIHCTMWSLDIYSILAVFS